MAAHLLTAWFVLVVLLMYVSGVFQDVGEGE
jgi:hypothetical protein